MQMTWFYMVSRRKVDGAMVCWGVEENAGKNMVMILNGEEELECEVHVDAIHLEHALEFK